MKKIFMYALAAVMLLALLAAQTAGAWSGSGMCGKITIGCTFDEDGDPVDGEVFKRGIDESPYTYTPTN